MSDRDHPDPASLDWPTLARALARRPAKYSADAAWRELERVLDASAPPADMHPLRVPPPRFGSPNWAARIAALVVLALGIGLVWRMSAQRDGDPVNPAALREVATAPTQRATVRLADGTRVELGVDSKLRYAPEFGARGRDVYLEGQAYFDVVHDARHPFKVHTSHAILSDLGTKFNVRSYADVPAVEVVVADGLVALASTKAATRDSIVLACGDLGRIEPDGSLTRRHGVDVAAQLGWLEGRLVFADTPLGEAVPLIARWYGVAIRVADSALLARRYTASIKQETFPQLLDLMARSLELRVVRDRDTVLLYGKSGR